MYIYVEKNKIILNSYRMCVWFCCVKIVNAETLKRFAFVRNEITRIENEVERKNSLN